MEPIFVSTVENKLVVDSIIRRWTEERRAVERLEKIFELASMERSDSILLVFLLTVLTDTRTESGDRR
jgi:hypothetical protein